MKRNSVLKLKNVVWGSAGVVVLIILVILVAHSGARSTDKTPPPSIVAVAFVQQKDVVRHFFSKITFNSSRGTLALSMGTEKPARQPERPSPA
jgi:hypothetical protein